MAAHDQLPNSRELLRSSAISQILQRSTRTVRRLCLQGKLPAIRVGRAWLVPADALDALTAASLRRLAEVSTHSPVVAAPQHPGGEGSRVAAQSPAPEPHAVKKEGASNGQPVDNKGESGNG